jgi:hypothetical protein
VVISARGVEEKDRPRMLVHSWFASASNEVFDRIFAAVLSDSTARELLRPLILVHCLPDASHWRRHLDEAKPETDGQILAHAVADNFDHQSEKATDVRWMKVMHDIVSGQMQFPTSMRDLLEDFRLYPDRGDMRSVRPHIRAMEMGLRSIEIGGKDLNIDAPPIMGEAFWKEMKDKTDCILPRGFEPPTIPPKDLRDDVFAVVQEVQHHFDQTIATTDVDPRHDGAFGLVLFASSYLMSLASFYGHDFPFSRIVLRSIVEAFITLEFLGTKDDPTLWSQYRRYGAGQAKLAFLKNIREEDAPSFFDLHLMESLANEDMWMEFEDIHIGNWAKTDLRSMATQAGVKAEYDKYYDWTSGFAHGHWMAVRETAFVNCMNPLHRYHRIPGPPMSPLPSVLPDAAKLLNRMLDRLNQLYPSFKPRITAHKSQKGQPDEPGGTPEDNGGA